jgi:hypothetical protein
LANVRTGAIIRPERTLIGGVYSKYLRELADSLVAPAFKDGVR